MATINMYLRSKARGYDLTEAIDVNGWYCYGFAIRQGCCHDEAANFQGWAELACVGEVYDCANFYAEILG